MTDIYLHCLCAHYGLHGNARIGRLERPQAKKGGNEERQRVVGVAAARKQHIVVERELEAERADAGEQQEQARFGGAHDETVRLGRAGGRAEKGGAQWL